jgi:hypothetical protein
LLAAPRTDPGERNYRTGLLPWVMTSNRQSGQGCRSFGLCSQRSASRIIFRHVSLCRCVRGGAAQPVAEHSPECAFVVLQRTPAKRMFAASELPSAKTRSRDILFQRSTDSRNGAECGRFRPSVRTTSTRPEAHLGPFSDSLRPLSLTQPNHGHFGTVVRSPPDRWVMRCQLGRGFESAALRRSEQGSNNSIRYGCVLRNADVRHGLRGHAIGSGSGRRLLIRAALRRAP